MLLSLSLRGFVLTTSYFRVNNILAKNLFLMLLGSAASLCMCPSKRNTYVFPVRVNTNPFIGSVLLRGICVGGGIKVINQPLFFQEILSKSNLRGTIPTACRDQVKRGRE